jgi:hypothetical protein
MKQQFSNRPEFVNTVFIKRDGYEYKSEQDTNIYGFYKFRKVSIPFYIILSLIQTSD